MLKWVKTLVSNAADADSVAASQTPAGAGALTLTASTVTFGSDSAQRLTITSAADISNRTFTIVGTDPAGNALTVSGFTGPNNSTVTTSVAFKSVTSVTISGAAAGALTVGNSAAAESTMFVPDVRCNPFSIGMGCVINGGTTPTYSIQHTFDNPLASSLNYNNLTWFDHSVIVDKTANQDGNYDFPVMAIRLELTAAGSVTVTLYQSGV